MNHLDLGQLFPSIPDYIFRKDIGELTGGIVSPRTLANHDSKGTGPEERLQVNGKIAYSKESFFKWLEGRTVLLARLDTKNSLIDSFLESSSKSKNN